MKFEVKNRFTGAAQFTAEIECDEAASVSIKMGLAVKWAVKTRAYLAGAYLADANLNGLTGLNDWIKCIQIEDWPITYTSEVMQIGCQRHTLDAWRAFRDAEIRAMGGMRALNFWRKWKDWIFQAIDMAPAKPTNSKSETDQ